MIQSFELEKQLLAGLLRNSECFAEICSFIDERDFYSEDSVLHKTIFLVIKQAIENCDGVDDVIIAQRVKSIGLSFTEDINPADYIKSLAMKKVIPESTIKAAKELKKYTIRREIHESSLQVSKKMLSIPADSSYVDIIECADKIYNSRINHYEIGNDMPQNIYEDMEAIIEDRGNNPVKDFGMMGPHKKINDMYGSLLRAGNITVVVARSGVGKTQFCMDYATKVAAEYDIPVLHFDNGEMSQEELMMRQCTALSGVPMHLLETGDWRRSGKEVVDKVRSVWPKVKKMKFFYYNVGGLDVDAMINTLKRFYFQKVGRGNKMIFSFDYIKTTSERSDKNEWQLVGEMVDKFKKCIQKEILEDGKPIISMLTSVQSNRSGITNNRASSNIVDDESIVSLSDRIIHFCSHMFILRKKTTDEIATEGNQFGSHKLINVKSRHLGKDLAGALEPVRIGDTLRNNFVNLEFKNFNISERGDLRDIAQALQGREDLDEDTDFEAPPRF